MSREIFSLARYRFKRAKAAYRDGVSLFRKGSYESALNRFYYAAFYSARALLALKRLDASKHSGVISLFGQHFVKSGLIDKETARAFRGAMSAAWIAITKISLRSIWQKPAKFKRRLNSL